MSSHPVRRLVAGLGLAVAMVLACAATAAAAPHVEGHFAVSSLDTNNKIVAGPDGNIWVTLSDATKDVARITPGGEVKEFELENVTKPSGIAVGPEGKIWVTQSEGVAAFSPSEPTKTKTQAIAQVKDNASIVAGPDGNMWVATEGFLIKVPPANPSAFNNTAIAGLAPHDIDVAGPLLVIADLERILTVTTAGTEVGFKIPGSSQGVAGAPNGQIAFSDPLASPELVGLITPPNQPQTSELLGDPFGVAFGPDGNFWVAQAGSGKEGVTRLTPSGQKTSFGGFAKDSNPRQIAPGPNDTVWVTLQGSEGVPPAVARIAGVEPPAALSKAPQTKLAKGPKTFRTAHRRAKVKFRFSSTTAGARFECALTKARKGRKKAAKPHFKACRSPKSYRLRPGRYRFSVRAVKAGLVDPSPATRSFRVVHVHKH